MKELSHNQEDMDNKLKHSKSLLRWPIIAASLVFSFSAYAMVNLYSIVHWQIMLHNGTLPDERFRNHVYVLLNGLMCLRLTFAILAAVYAGLSFVQGPKVAAFIASFFATLALLTIFIVM